MIVDARLGMRGLLIDLATNQPIRKARWADLDTGEYEAFQLDASGNIVSGFREDGTRGPITYKRTSVLRWVTAEPLAKACATNTTLHPYRHRLSAHPLFPMADRACQHYGCSRLATWKVADEEVLPPLVTANGAKLERARCIGVRYYCDWHYQRPRLYDAGGGLIEEVDVKARPG